MALAIGLITIILYLITAYLLWQNVRDGCGSAGRLALVLWLFAILGHIGLLVLAIITPQGIDLSLFHTITLAALLVSIILLIICMQQALAAIGIIILPLVALSIGLSPIKTSDNLISSYIIPGIQLHIVSSLLAYSLFIVAGIQALVIHRQIRYLKLKSKSKNHLISTLPTLEAMEAFLFALIKLGLVLLTVGLVSGWIYHDDLFAQHLVHKTVLSVVAWFVYSIVLIGKQLYGWRTNTAVSLVLTATVLLVLSYLGSKFVLEVVLDRI